MGRSKGVRVLMLAVWAHSLPGMLLADMGASVVRVTRPPNRSSRALGASDGLAAEQDVVNRGVSSVAIDLKDAAGTENVLGAAGLAGTLRSIRPPLRG